MSFKFNEQSDEHSRAHFLVNGLFKVLRVDDGADLARAVGRPVWGHHLHGGFARVQPVGLK